MDEMIKGLMAKCGLSEEQATKVFEFLQENSSKVPEWLAQSGLKDQIADKLPGGLGKLF